MGNDKNIFNKNWKKLRKTTRNLCLNSTEHKITQSHVLLFFSGSRKTWGSMSAFWRHYWIKWLSVQDLIIYEPAWEQRERGKKKTEHVTVIKCVLLPALWQAPKYNSERKADRRPDGIGSRYLSEINRMLFVSPRGKQRRRFLKSAATRSDRIFTHTGIRAFHARPDHDK